MEKVEKKGWLNNTILFLISMIVLVIVLSVVGSLFDWQGTYLKLNTITGEEMLENLKKIRNFNIPVILLSKDNKYEYNEEYLNMGFSDIIIKPIKKEILLEKINKNIINREDIFKKKQMIEAALLHKAIFFLFQLNKKKKKKK